MHWAYASFFLTPWGRFEESVAEMQREVDRDPLNVPWRSVLSAHLIQAERYDRAIENAHQAIEVDENHWMPYFMLSLTYAYSGRFAEAIAPAERAHRARHRGTLCRPECWRAHSPASGRRAERKNWSGRWGTPRPIWGRVEYHLLCSEIDAAADWYERMIEERELFAIVSASAPTAKHCGQSALAETGEDDEYGGRQEQ